MDETKDENIEDKQRNGKEDDYPDPPILSPVATMDCDKMTPSSDKEKQLDTPPPAELVINKDNSVSTDNTKQFPDEPKKKNPKIKKGNFEYQFQLRQYHIVKGQKLFKCDICAGTYRYAFSLKRHFLRNHINYKYLSKADISNCNINVSLISDNYKRLNNNNEQDDIKEKSLFNGASNTLTENSQIMFPSLYSCYLCWEYFHNKTDLKNHIENHSVIVKQKEFKCDKCEIKFTLKKNLLRHLAGHNNEKTFICKYCSKQFLTLSSQKKHERIHEGKKSYRCIYCASIFTCNSELIEHTENQHKDFYHPCNVCSKFFDSEQSLSEHIEQHVELLSTNNSPKSKIFLNEEDKSFIYGDDALEITDICNKFDYTCTVCKKKFMSYVNMCRHRRLAHQNSAKKRGRPQKSKINKIENDDKIIFNALPERSESEFYMNIAQKISDNLVNYIDGNFLQIKQYSDTNNLDDSFLNNEINISWDAYNFPPSFNYHQVEMSEPEPEKISTESDCDNLNYEASYNENISISINFSKDSLNLNDEKYLEFENENTKISNGDDNNNNNNNKQLIGQTIPLTYICCACVERFHSIVAIEEHKINNHPNVFCTHIEIEGEKNVPPEFCKQFCNPVGLLKRYIVPSIDAQENNGLTCTKCKMVFNSVSDLHLHILECGGDDNFKQYKGENYGRRKGVRKKRLREVKCQTYSPPKRKYIERSPKTKLTKDDDLEKFDCCMEQEMKENQAAHATYSCKDCSKTFNHSSTFERHKRGCRQKLSLDRNSHRKLHMKNVKSAGQHPCPYCKRNFTYLTSLKKHLRDICSKKIKCKSRSNISNTKNKLECTEQVSDRRIENIVEQIDYTLENSNFKTEENLDHLSEKKNLKVLEENIKNEIESEQKSDSIESDLCSIENTKSDIILENEELLSLKQIQNNENLHTELILESGTLVKPENNLQRGLFPQQRCCPHCLRSFAYLANFRRHVKEVCPVKKQMVKENEENGIKSKCSMPVYNVTTFSVKGKIEDSVIGLLRDQSRQIELMKGTEPEENNPTPSSRFRTFSCKVCHKIFLSLVKMLQHRLSHKLQSDESEDLPKLDLGLMKKLQENSIGNAVYEQRNDQEILNDFDEFLNKPNKELDKETNNELLNLSEETNKSLNIENNIKSDNTDFCCEKCGKKFPNNSSKQRHYKLAHKELNNKKSITSLEVNIYKSSKGKGKKNLLKSTDDADKQSCSDKAISNQNNDVFS